VRLGAASGRALTAISMVGLAGVLGFVPVGCAQKGSGNAARVNIGAFRSQAGHDGVGEALTGDRVEPGMVRLDPGLGFDTSLGDRGVLSVEVLAGPPEPTTVPSLPSGTETFVEAKVGEINGTPVFASEFFDEQFAQRLRADSRTKPPNQWRADAMLAIRTKLSELIQDALLTQEGRATLTPDEQKGLLFVLNRFEQSLQSQHMGSSQAFRQALEEEGESVAGKREQRERRMLQSRVIRPLIRTVQITPADISRMYRQQYQLYHYGLVQFRQIQVRVDQPDDVAAVTAELEKGTPFAEVASQEWNGFRRDTGGLRDEIHYVGDYETAELFSQPALNTAALSLKKGEWTGPIEVNGTIMVWLFSERFERTDISQYEAQLHIGAKLGARERAEVIRRYVDRLRDRASFTDENIMAEQLLGIAIERFYQPGAG
jgi:hypothetical protein